MRMMEVKLRKKKEKNINLKIISFLKKEIKN